MSRVLPTAVVQGSSGCANRMRQYPARSVHCRDDFRRSESVCGE
jgi:hypothetical protein